MANKKSSSFQASKKDPFKKFRLLIAGNKGVNQTLTPEEMDDAESLQVINLLPIGDGLVRKIEGYTPIAQLSANIVLFVNEYINGNLVKFVILSDGSAGILSGSPLAYSQVAPAGTFSTDPSQVDITTWQAQYLLIIDANKGYFAYQPGWTFTTTSWAQNTQYNVGQVITQSGATFYCVYAGTSAQTTYPTWAENTAYAVGQKVQPSTANGYYYQCTVAGTSGSTAPTWPTTPGQTVNDGTVTWQCYQIVTPTWNTTVGSVVQDGTVVWMCVSLSATGLLTISPSVKGNTIAVWQQRVFAANGRLVNYTAAGSFLDFTASDNGGYFEIANTNLKVGVQKIIPYIDSLYFIGDHAIVAMTGTTATNDPTTWYQSELFSSLGTLNGKTVVNYNNTLYLTNEYGIYMVSSTQSQKIDYKIDLSQIQIQDAPAGIAMVNNLMFYLIPITYYSFTRSKQANMLLAYCIDLNQAFYIDLGIDTDGVYVTKSTTDHSVYTWNGQYLNQIFNGTTPVAALIQTKYFDIQDPYVIKMFRYLMLYINVRRGIPNFMVWGTSNILGNQQQQINSPPSPNIYQSNVLALLPYSYTYSSAFLMKDANGLYYLWTNQGANSSNYTIGAPGVGQNATQTGVNIGALNISFINPTTTFWSPFLVFYVNVGGNTVSFTIAEVSNSVWDLMATQLEGFIGKTLR